MIIIHWLIKNWKETLIGGVFTFLLYKLLDVIWNVLADVIQNGTFCEMIKQVFNLKVSMPVWLVTMIIAMLLVIIIPMFIKLFSKKSIGKKLLPEKAISNYDKIKIEFQSPELYKPLKADQSINITLNSNFLGSKSGIFSIWAYVADVHNENSKRFMYIVGYATKKGVEQQTPGYARYPNAWAINRIRPHENCPHGIWRFWCNNADIQQTRIDTSEILSGGWHLFTVAWSERLNYIKFIIDKKEIGQRDFEHWPSDFSESVRIGTWPNLASEHCFDSLIGPWYFVKSNFDMRIIEDFLENKPE